VAFLCLSPEPSIGIEPINKPRDQNKPVVFVFYGLFAEGRRDDEQTKKLWMEECGSAMTSGWSQTG